MAHCWDAGRAISLSTFILLLFACSLYIDNVMRFRILVITLTTAMGKAATYPDFLHKIARIPCLAVCFGASGRSDCIWTHFPRDLSTASNLMIDNLVIREISSSYSGSPLKLTTSLVIWLCMKMKPQCLLSKKMSLHTSWWKKIKVHRLTSLNNQYF